MTDDRDNLTHGERIKALILTCGIKLWRADPGSVSARAIGKMMDMTHSAILYHFGCADALKSAIAVEAVRIADPIIVPMLIAAKHSAIADMSIPDRSRFLWGCQSGE